MTSSQARMSSRLLQRLDLAVPVIHVAVENQGVRSLTLVHLVCYVVSTGKNVPLSKSLSLENGGLLAPVNWIKRRKET
jgi:hypothetical protein